MGALTNGCGGGPGRPRRPGGAETQNRAALSGKGERENRSPPSPARAREEGGGPGALVVVGPPPRNGPAPLGVILSFTIVKLNKPADDSRGRTVRPFSRAHAECEELAPWSSLAPKGDTRLGNDRRARHLRRHARRHTADAGCV